MKTVTRRAFCTIIIAIAVIIGMIFYCFRYIENGSNWASYFGNENVTGTGTITDRNGIVLASIDSGNVTYASDYTTRLANYQLVGDTSGNIGTGAISAFAGKLSGFNYIFGTTNAKGSNVQLTVDSELNTIAYNALNGYDGAVLVANYETGEILCMTSTPTQDPSNPNSSPVEGTYLNKCISGTITPGSTFKLVTLAAALENVTDIYNETWTCNGSIDIDGVTINCTGSHGTQDIYSALSNSCNVAFAQIAQEVGAKTLAKYAKDYGYTTSHSMDGITTAAGRFDSDAYGSDLSWAGIGQYTDLVCPYSALRLVSAIGNGGKIYEPTILGHSKIDQSESLMDSSTANSLKVFMRNNVESSYGTSTFPGLNICAKTGTAEVDNGNSHGWLVGFLDDDTHPYAFVVVVENSGSGLRYAGPIANTVLQAAVSKY